MSDDYVKQASCDKETKRIEGLIRALEVRMNSIKTELDTKIAKTADENVDIKILMAGIKSILEMQVKNNQNGEQRIQELENKYIKFSTILTNTSNTNKTNILDNPEVMKIINKIVTAIIIGLGLILTVAIGANIDSVLDKLPI